MENSMMYNEKWLSCCGALGRIRTCDTRFRKPMLYPLSYEGWPAGTWSGGLLDSHIVHQDARSQRRSC
jgi:hypothetical protein